MNPEIFMSYFERTDYGDSIFSSFGRALVISTRFERNCKSLASLFVLKSESIFVNEEEYKHFINIIYNKSLFEQIKTITSVTKEFTDILQSARIARNEIVHELTVGYDCLPDLLPKNYNVENEIRLRELIESIALGDFVVSFLITKHTNEFMPHKDFLLSYKERIVNWVIEN